MKLCVYNLLQYVTPDHIYKIYKMTSHHIMLHIGMLLVHNWEFIQDCYRGFKQVSLQMHFVVVIRCLKYGWILTVMLHGIKYTRPLRVLELPKQIQIFNRMMVCIYACTHICMYTTSLQGYCTTQMVDISHSCLVVQLQEN